MSENSYDAALDLLRRLNPSHVSQNLLNLTKLNPEISEDLLSSVDIPLGTATDPQSNRKFLTCDYNRDLDSFRSPWSNEYFPKLDDDESYKPTGKIRELEIKLNNAFDNYRDLYYEGGVSSVYVWNDEESGDIDDGFSGVVLIKKTNDGNEWDSIHVIEVIKETASTFEYKITSTIILSLQDDKELNLNGNLIRQNSKTLRYENELSHIVNIGSFIEDIESNLRNLLQQVYFDKNKDIVSELRSVVDLDQVQQDKLKHKEVIDALN
ncbi:hypothetical protein WICMUC_005253 [Wickerhamomyces mucosus]|uniref:F-actin-capping protein subunit beta n=1 Tax=Wickerhamomyces mucosus TaxID=1378264 RepID=A0A9P8P8S8_9ASCO|nr:hypothetical protein WICMUC_005253 [Wickerhamomyces mucosus]